MNILMVPFRNNAFLTNTFNDVAVETQHPSIVMYINNKLIEKEILCNIFTITPPPSLEVSLTKDVKHFFNEQLKTQRQWKEAHSMLMTLQK